MSEAIIARGGANGKGGCRTLIKARRLLAEGAVEHVAGLRYRVRGDSGTHHLMVQDRDVACSCKAAGFGWKSCSHKLSLELYLSARRLAA